MSVCLVRRAQVREGAAELARAENILLVQLPVQEAIRVEEVAPEHLRVGVAAAAAIVEAGADTRLVNGGHAHELLRVGLELALDPG